MYIYQGNIKQENILNIYREYYMGARKYGISLRVFNSIATMYYFVYHINTLNENMSRQTPNDNRKVRWR